MNVKCLAVDSDFDIANSYVLEWERRCVSMECVDDMTEGIQKLLLDDEYIFVGINGDAVDFMPLLRTMRSVTNIPVFIVVSDSNFTTESEVAAIEEGADLYARWHKSPENNVTSVLAHIERLSARSRMPRPVSDIRVCRYLLIAPLQHSVFVKNKKIEISKIEFDILYHFMDNRGLVLTAAQIYRRVWNEDYRESNNEAVKSSIKRIRKKISGNENDTDFIENIRGVGYKMP